MKYLERFFRLKGKTSKTTKTKKALQYTPFFNNLIFLI